MLHPKRTGWTGRLVTGLVLFFVLDLAAGQTTNFDSDHLDGDVEDTDFDLEMPQEDVVQEPVDAKTSSIVYFITAPNSFAPSQFYPVSITISNATSPVTVKVTIYSPPESYGQQPRRENITVASASESVAPGTTAKLRLQIPASTGDDQIYNYRLLAEGQDEDGNTFSSSGYVNRKSALSAPDTFVFVQTDKPLYKAGDTVNYRIVVVDGLLRPVAAPINIQIFDPQRNLIQQSSNPSADPPAVRGFANGSLELASQAPQGSWSIEVTSQGKKKVASFSVEEYVLPRFDVNLKIPAFASTTQKTLTIGITSKFNSRLHASSFPDPRANLGYVLLTYHWPTIRPQLISWQLDHAARDTGLDAEEFPKQISYTFGEPVKGTATISVRGGPIQYVQDSSCMANKESVNPVMFASESGEMSSFAPSSFGMPTSFMQRCPPIERAPWKNFTIDNFNGKATVTVRLSDIVTSGADSWISIKAFGSVTEGSSGSSKNSSKSLSLRPQIYQLQFTKSSPSFTPGSPYTIYVRAILVDGRPIPPTTKQLKIRLTTMGSAFGGGNAQVNDVKSFSVPSDGVVPVNFVPPLEARSLTLVAQLGQVTESTSAEGSSSPSNSLLKIIPMTDSPQVGELVSFSVELTNATGINSVNYTVLAKNRIIVEDSSAVSGSSAAIQFRVSPSMAPRARLLAYYMTSDNEVVANVMDFAVGGFMRNFVNMSVLPSSGAAFAKPGENARIQVVTSPNSLVATLGMDQSLLLISRNTNDLSEQTVLDLIDDKNDNRWAFSKYSNSTNYWTADSGSTWGFLQNAGLLVLGNAMIPGAPSASSGGYGGFGSSPGSHSMMAPMASSSSGSGSGGGGGAFMMSMMSESSSGSNQGQSSRPAPAVRRNFRETFLYEIALSGPNGTVEMERKVPDTITSWICTAFSLNNDLGLGITKQASKLKVFQPFFVVLNLPFSIVRGETLQTEVLVFNYLNRDQNVQVTFTADGQDWRNNSFHAPTQQKTVLVPSNNSTRLVFPLSPTIVGDVDLKVVAQSEQAGDAVEKKLLVKAEGVQQQFTTPVFVDLRNQRSFSRRVPVTLPANIVPGSEKVLISAIGDILGPSINGIDNLIRIPSGCGEQNLLTLAPLVYLLPYFEATSSLDSDKRSRLIRNMNTGYQRQLTFKHKDGSYSAFGSRDKTGSTFLTAYVLKTFAKASSYVPIDRDAVNQAAQWLLNNQARNGSFPEVGKLFDRQLQGGVNGPVSLTAYVLLAMIEAQPSISLDLRNNMQRAFDYLQSQLRRPLDAYQLAIALYALQQSNSNGLQQAEQNFQSLAVQQNGMKHWSMETETVTNQAGRWAFEYEMPAKDIEMTAYGLLQYARRRDLQGGYPVMAWLLSKRNAQGGFQSSQEFVENAFAAAWKDLRIGDVMDTVVALQALAAFGALAKDQRKSLTTKISGRTFSTGFDINDANALQLQSFEPSTVDNSVEINANGQGTAIVQVTWLYNVLTVPEKPAFDLKVNAKKSAETALKVTLCARHLSPEPSNMALAEVSLPSGYQFDEEQTDAILDDLSSGVSRIDTMDDATKAHLYFDEITPQQNCLSLQAYRIYQVEGALNATAVIYDYYKPSNRKTVLYSLAGTDVVSNSNDLNAQLFQ